MQIATSGSDTHALEPALHGEAAQFAAQPAERRRGTEYLRGQGFDYPVALFWGAYLAFCTGALIAVAVS